MWMEGCDQGQVRFISLHDDKRKKDYRQNQDNLLPCTSYGLARPCARKMSMQMRCRLSAGVAGEASPGHVTKQGSTSGRVTSQGKTEMNRAQKCDLKRAALA